MPLVGKMQLKLDISVLNFRNIFSQKQVVTYPLACIEQRARSNFLRGLTGNLCDNFELEHLLILGEGVRALLSQNCHNFYMIRLEVH